MQSREVTLKELWQTCRVCEDSCRRMADVLGEVMRQADAASPPQRVTVAVDLPDAWPTPEPDPPCVPPFCLINFSQLAETGQRLASRAEGLAAAVEALCNRDPKRNIRFYTCVPGSPNTPLP